MENVTLSHEQISTIVDQLSTESRKEFLDELLFKEWLNSPEGEKLMKERIDDVKNNRLLTIEQMRKKLRPAE